MRSFSGSSYVTQRSHKPIATDCDLIVSKVTRAAATGSWGFADCQRKRLFARDTRVVIESEQCMSAVRFIWSADVTASNCSQAQSSAGSRVIDGILIRTATDWVRVRSRPTRNLWLALMARPPINRRECVGHRAYLGHWPQVASLPRCIVCRGNEDHRCKDVRPSHHDSCQQSDR